MIIKFKKVHPKAQEPVYATAGSAAFDLYICLDNSTYLNPGECKIISTGLAIEIPEYHAALVLPRSGLGAKQGIVLGNLVGLIDSDYRGTWGISVWNRNHNGEAFKISNGDRLAQVIIVPIVLADFEEVDQLVDTVRSNNGFGSTGLK